MYWRWKEQDTSATSVRACFALDSMQTCCELWPLIHVAFCCRDRGGNKISLSAEGGCLLWVCCSRSLRFCLECLFCHESFVCDKWSPGNPLRFQIFRNMQTSNASNWKCLDFCNVQVPLTDSRYQIWNKWCSCCPSVGYISAQQEFKWMKMIKRGYTVARGF